MNYVITIVILIFVAIAALIVLKLAGEERENRKKEKELMTVVPVLKKAGIDLNKDDIETALQKANGDKILLDEIKKHILDKMSKANKTGDSQTVRQCNADLRIFDKYDD